MPRGQQRAAFPRSIRLLVGLPSQFDPYLQVLPNPAPGGSPLPSSGQSHVRVGAYVKLIHEVMEWTPPFRNGI